MNVVTTVLETARNPNEILSFNLASQALNNSFFLDNLVSDYHLCGRLTFKSHLHLNSRLPPRMVLPTTKKRCPQASAMLSLSSLVRSANSSRMLVRPLLA